MNMRLILCLGLLASMAPGAALAQFTNASLDSGWYRSNLHEPANTGYYVGRASLIDYRSFFLFDVSDEVAPITSAILRIPISNVVTPSASELLEIYDVTTSSATLVGGSSPANTYTDLGSGTLYGAVSVPVAAQDYVDVELNAAAIAALNSATGQIAFGGRNATISGLNDQYLVGERLLKNPELIVNPTAAPVPVPVYSTAAHPLQSKITVQLMLGQGQPGNTDPMLVNLADIPLHGEISAASQLDASNSGFVQVHGASLMVDDVLNRLINVVGLGTLRLDLEESLVDLWSQKLVAENGSIQIDPSDVFRVGVIGGEVTLRNPTGTLATIAGSEFPLVRDFAVDPVITSLADRAASPLTGSIDQGTGLFTPLRELNLHIPPVNSQPFEAGGVSFYLRISAELHTAIVPEPSTWILAATGLAALAAPAMRRRKRAE